MARKRTIVLRRAELVQAVNDVLEHREAARRHDSALRKLRGVARPYAEDDHMRLRIGKAVIELEWTGARKAVIPEKVREKYTSFDERARLEMQFDRTRKCRPAI